MPWACTLSGSSQLPWVNLFWTAQVSQSWLSLLLGSLGGKLVTSWMDACSSTAQLPAALPLGHLADRAIYYRQSHVKRQVVPLKSGEANQNKWSVLQNIHHAVFSRSPSPPCFSPRHSDKPHCIYPCGQWFRRKQQGLLAQRAKSSLFPPTTLHAC